MPEHPGDRWLDRQDRQVADALDSMDDRNAQLQRERVEQARHLHEQARARADAAAVERKQAGLDAEALEAARREVLRRQNPDSHRP